MLTKTTDIFVKQIKTQQNMEGRDELRRQYIQSVLIPLCAREVRGTQWDSTDLLGKSISMCLLCVVSHKLEKVQDRDISQCQGKKRDPL